MAWLALCLMPLAGQAVALADEDSKARAKALIESADLHYRLSQFDRALADYQAAYKLHQHPALLFNIAQTYRQGGDMPRALFYYKLYLADWERVRPQTTIPYREEVLQHIQQCTGRLEEKRRQKEEQQRREAQKKKEAQQQKKAQQRRAARPERSRLKLIGVPPGALVLVDGAAAGSAPLGPGLSLRPGRRHVEVRAAGFEPWTNTLSLRAGDEVQVLVDLRPLPRRSSHRLWLATGITSAALAAGALGLGVAFDLRSQEETHGSVAWADKANVGLAGYITAGSLALASVASWVLFIRAGN